MKNVFRSLIGFIVVMPFAFLTLILAIFIGKQKAVRILGPLVTICAKSIQQLFPPKIKTSLEFDLFKSKLKKKQKIWKILYDYPIEYPNKDTANLFIENCPFAEAMNKLDISELGHYMCQGDWEVAKENSEKWIFKRSCTIGTGGSLCDFSYRRIQN